MVEPGTALSIVGLVTVVTIVALLVSRKVTPVVALTLVPFLGALAAGFGLADIGEYFTSGLSSVVQVATMFIFAILFFGVLQDAAWAGPLGRAAAVLELEPVALWHPLIPVQLAGAGLLVGFSVLFGLRERARIRAAGFGGSTPVAEHHPVLPAASDLKLSRPQLLLRRSTFC